MTYFQAEFAKALETLDRIHQLYDRLDDMPVETFRKYWILDQIEHALDGDQND